MTQVDSRLLCLCSIILVHYKKRQHVVRMSLTHSAAALCSTFLFLPHFEVVSFFYPALHRCTAKWNLWFTVRKNSSKMMRVQEIRDIEGGLDIFFML